jgi:hypothetical protein
MSLSCSAARVVPRLGVLLVVCQLITSAQAVIRDGGIDPSNIGKGTWIYILPNAINHLGGNVQSVTNLNSLMVFFKTQGLRYVIIKAASGPDLYPSNGNPQFTAAVVNAGHAAGLWVFGYNRSDGTDSQPHIDSIARLPDGRIQLQISGGPGNFAIECAPVLSGWTQLSSLTATGAVFQYVDPETNQASRFYRVRLVP